MALKNWVLQSWRKSTGWGLLIAGTTAAAVSCGSEDTPSLDDGVMSEGGAMGHGGQKDMTPSESVLTIVHRSPVAESELNTAEPLRYEFNVPLDEATVESALRVRASGRDVPIKWAVKKKELLIWLESIPPLPATLSVALGRDLKGEDGETFAGDSLTVTMPLWFPLPEIDVESGSARFAQTERFSLIAYEDQGELRIFERRNGEQKSLDVPGKRKFDNVKVVAAEAGEESVTLIWVEHAGANRGVYTATWDGSAWEEGETPVHEAEELHVAISRSNDSLTLAVLTHAAVQVYSGEIAGELERVGSVLNVDEARPSELAVTLAADGSAIVATVTDEGRIEVHQQAASSWTSLGEVARARTAGLARPSLAVHEEKLWLAYEDGDITSNHAYVAELAGNAFKTHPALDLELDAEVTHLQLTSGGELYVAWTEHWGIEHRAFVARLNEGKPTILGREALGDSQGGDLANEILESHLTLDVHQQPSLLLVTDAAVVGARFNGSPTLPAGREGRGDRGSCAIPVDGPDFPATLSETGCYTNLGQRRLVSAAIPYNINSALWSDGTAKRRYVLVPSTKTVGFTATGGWVMPVGTIVIKEFYLEKVVGDPSTLFPVETRFLVKRCEEESCAVPWQGYSYRWNNGGTDGTLLEHIDDQVDHSFTVTENGTSSVRQHIYPGRQTCFSCHSVSAGRMLGIDSPQLSRSQDYGDYVADQLTTWTELGLFGDSASPDDLADVLRLPSPADVSHSLTTRARAYFDSNCGHCHHPGTMQPGAGNLDLRFDGAGLVPSGNICSRITPGDPDTSLIHQRQKNRADAVPTQMPPIATHLPDERQLQLSSEWILHLLETEECTP